jgi:hypothetical protein
VAHCLAPPPPGGEPALNLLSMPKVQKLRKHATKTLSNPYPTDSSKRASGADGKTVVLSRGQRKRQIKRGRREEFKQELKSKLAAQAHLPESSTFLFSSLESSLPDPDHVVHPSATGTSRSNKMAGKVAVREVERMRLVQDLPSFQQNPLDTVRFHIEQMVTLKQRQLQNKSR